MAANAGNRAYFYSSTAAPTVSLPYPTRGKVFVYAKEGETLYLGSSAIAYRLANGGGGNAEIRVTSPNNIVYSTTTLGAIEFRTQELAGPSLNGGGDGGYNPFIVPVNAGQDGIWQIEFIAPTNNDNDVTVAAANTLIQTSTSYIAAFDVSVRNTANTSFIPGRAYLNSFSGNMGSFSSKFSSIFKILTKDGYIYDVNNNGQAGYRFVFFVNNKGFRDGLGNALYESVNTTTNPPVHDPRLNDTGTDITHKIFFNQPNIDMPTSAAMPGGSNTWLLNTPVSPTVSNFLFTGKEGTANSAGTYPLGGYISFDTNQSGSYILKIDANQNGSLDDAVDVRLTGTAVNGSNKIYWDGRNGLNVPVAGNFTFNPANMSITLVGGEVHFPFLDVENNVDGIIITRTNGVNAPNDVVYWDDDNITGGTGPASNPRVTPINGISSSINGHEWGNNGYNSTAFGNEKGLDTWTYVVSSPVLPFQNVQLKQADLLVQSVTSNIATACVGQNIVYTVAVKNNGPNDVSRAKFAFNFPSEYVVSNVTAVASGGTATIDNGVISSTDYKADLDMQNQSVLTFTITGSVTAYPTVGTLPTNATIMRPQDVTDPDATNNDDLPPTDPLIECNSGTPGCNNMMDGPGITITRRNISIAGAGATEGNSGTANILFPVTLSGTSNCPITVDYSITHGTTNNTDFVGGLTGSITIPAGDLTANIIIPVNPDKIIEASESFTITISNATGGNQITTASAAGSIINDDSGQITVTKIDGNEQGEIKAKYIFSFPVGVTSDQPVEIDYNLTGATGNGADYAEPMSGTIIIPAGQENATLELSVKDDQIVEGTEEVLFNTVAVRSAYSAPLGTSITLDASNNRLHIFDNDQATLTLSGPVTKPEGDTGNTAFEYTLTLNNATATGFTINYSLTDGTATLVDGDFIADAQTLNFAGTAGESQTITVYARSDQKIEPDEYFNLVLSALSKNFSGRLTVPVSTVRANITNDDDADIVITKQNGIEGVQSAQFIFTLQDGKTVDQNTVINYNLGGSATGNGTDYTGALSGSVTILAGQNSAILTLPVADDNLIEGTETITITTGAVTSSYGLTITNSPQTLDIIDNDSGSISISDAAISEGNSGTKTLSFNVSLTGTVQGTFNIPYSTVNQTAIAGEDFTGVSAGAIVFANSSNEVKTINITINGDTKIEADETFQLILGALSNNYNGLLTIANNTATGTISNDDGAQITITPSNGNETGPAAASFKFSFPTGITSDTETIIAYSLGGTATNGTDYTGSVTNGTVKIDAGENAVILTLPVVDDLIVEDTETIVLSSGAVTSPYTIIVVDSNIPKTLTIQDNDVAKLTITGPPDVMEGADGTTQQVLFTVVLDKKTQRPFTIDYNTLNGTATTADDDYIADANQLSFTGSTANETLQIPITIKGDNKIEASEIFSLLLNAASLTDNFGGRLTLQNTSATARILNDDSGNITITKVDGTEGNADASFTFSLPPGIIADQPLSFNYTLGGSASANGVDYTGNLTGIIVIPAGQNSETLPLPVFNDLIVEGTETVSITTGPVSGPYGTTITNSPQTLNILDNDVATISIANKSVTEGDNGTTLLSFDVTLDKATKESFSVSYTTVDGTALASEDYIAQLAGSLTFTGTAGEVRTIDILIRGDQKIETDENFTVSLGTLSKTFGNSLTIANATATGTIINDDAAQISIIPTDGDEKNAVPGSFVLKLPDGFSVDEATQITYSIAGTATNGVDYTAVSGTATIPAGGNSTTINIAVVDDEIVENTETVILTIDNITSSYNLTAANSPQTLNILDNDEATLQLSGPVDVQEGADGTSQTVTFTVVLNKATSRSFTIDYETMDGTAQSADSDYISDDNQLSFTGAEGESKTVNITINGDGKIETDEIFSLFLSNLTDNFGGLLTIPNTSATAKILNDDVGNITITATDGTEGGTDAFFKFSFPAGITSDQPTTINYVLGGIAVSADYAPNPSPVTITIPAGQNSINLDMNIVNDLIVEGFETVELEATPIVSGYNINLVNDKISLNINDNDLAELTITGPVPALENHVGTSVQIFLVTLNRTTAKPFSIPYNTVNGSALAGEDYVFKSGTLNFNGDAGESHPIEVLINGDRKVEPDEIYNVVLGLPSNNFQNRLTVPVNNAAATIQNDDSGVIRMTVVHGSENGTNAKIRFGFTGGATASQPITLNYTLGGSAAATGVNKDYDADFPSTITIPAGASFAEINLAVINDDLIEDTETVEVIGLSLAALYPGISLDSDRPVVNITDNDVAELVLSGPPSVLELNSGFTELIYTVKLSKETTSGFNVNYSTSDGTATTANADYVGASGQLNFTGQANETKTFSVFVNGDLNIELSENFNINLTGLDNTFNNRLVVQGSPFLVTILDDDNENINITKQNGEEGVQDGSFTFSLPVGVVASENLTIDYSLSGALAGVDYTVAPSPLIIPAGSNSVSLPLVINNDQIVEGTETITINAAVRPNTLNIGINNPQETINVLDDDEGKITITPVAKPESDSGNNTFVFTVTLDKETAAPFTLSYSTLDGTALAGEDYEAAATGALISFDGNLVGETKTISIQVKGDTKIEADEVFHILLGALSNDFEGHLTIPANTVNGTIENDDSAVITITKQDAAEGGNDGEFIFSFPTGFTSDKETIINFTLGGSANGGGLDYTAIPSATSIVIPAGQPSATLILDINNDDIIELTENVTIGQLSVLSDYTGISISTSALPIVTIADNDFAKLTLTGPPSVNEGNSGTTELIYTVQLDKATTSSFRVDYSVIDGTATTSDSDYLPATGFLEFFGQAGETHTFKVFVRGDNKIEAPEDFSVQLSGLNNNFDNRLSIHGSPLTTQILNDDSGQITITSENGEEGVKDGSFTFSLPPNITIDKPLEIAYSLSGSATAGDDFDNLTGTVTLNANSNNVTIPVNIIDDLVVEGKEILTLNATLPIGVYGISLNNTSQSLDILDNDYATISINNLTVDEDDANTKTLNFTVNLDKATKLPFTVTYSTQDVSATAGEDYLAKTNNTISFTGLSNALTQPISIIYNGDLKIETNEIFNVILQSLSNTFENRLTISNTSGIGKATLLNDDSGLIKITAINGSENGTKGVFRFAFADGATSDQPTTINYTLGGTAVAGVDYTTTNLNSIIIPAGASFADAELVIVNDEIVEGDEFVTISGINVNSPYHNITIDNAVPNLVIEDNDVAKITLNGPLTVTEGNTGTNFVDFEVTLDKATASAFSLNFTTADDVAKVSDQDYIPLSGILDFTGAAGQTQSVRIFVNGDTKIEAAEQFYFAISNLSKTFGGSLSIAQAQTSATILNDDSSNITINKEDGEERMDGSRPAVFAFSLAEDVTADEDIIIPYTLSGVAAGLGTDYTGNIIGNITIPANANNVSLTLPVNDDNEVELTEDVIITTGTVASSYPVTVTNPVASLNIIDNDEALLTLSAHVPTIEGNSTNTAVTFTVTLNKKVSAPFTVKYKTEDGTALISDSDYEFTDGELSFNGNAGESRTITVNIKGDRKIEADEDFSLILENLSNNFNNRLAIANSPAIAIIKNDDVGDITLTAVNGKENGPQSGKFIFKLPAGITVDKPTLINYVLTGTAQAGTDYTNSISGTVTLLANSNEIPLDITVIDDLIIEETETVAIQINSVVSDYNLQMVNNTASLNIEDNDSAILTINGPLSIIEGNSGTQTLSFEVKLNKQTSSNFTVDYRSKDATATTADNDYQQVNGILAFAGLAEETKAINITVNGDTKVEGEEYFELILENLNKTFNGSLTIAGSPAKGIIIDDDNSSVNKTLTITKTDGEEGVDDASFTISLPQGVVLDSDTEIFYTLSGYATINQDYQTATTGSLLIPAGQNNVTLNLAVQDDEIVEDTETVIINTANINNSKYQNIVVANPVLSLDIKDNDTGTITVQPVSITEGNSNNKLLNFEVVLSHATSRGFEIAYNTTDGSAKNSDNDYVSKTGTIAFNGAAGEIQTISIQVNGDVKIEPDEIFNLNLVTPLTDDFNGRLTLPANSVTATITNDDSAMITVTKTDGEEGGAPVSFKFSFPADVTSDEPTQIVYQLGGSAIGGGIDYTGAISGTFILPANQNSEVLTLPVNNDLLIEENETVSINVSSVNSVYGNAITLNPLMPVAIIKDNDVAKLKINGPLSITEGDIGTKTITFTVSLDNNTGRSFSINYATSDGTATVAGNDYIPRSGTLNFAGNAGESHPITVLVNGDRNIENNEDFYVNLSGLSDNFNNRLLVENSPAKAIVLDDDNIPANKSIIISSSNGSEDGVPATFKFSFPPQVVSDAPTTIRYSLTGTAVGNNIDYNGVLAGSVIIPAGSNNMVLTLPIVNDNIVEGRETIRLITGEVINNSFNSISVVNSPIEAYIEDNDSGTFTVENIEIAEGNLGTKDALFTLKLDKPLAKPVTINYTTADGTATAADADYIPLSAAINFNGLINEMQVVKIRVNGDKKLEADEVFSLVLTAISNNFEGRLTLPTANATATIKNDDNALITVTGTNGAEAGKVAARFKFSFPAGVTADIPTLINYTLAGNATAGGTDFEGAVNGLISIPAGQESITLELPVLDDEIVEDDENISIVINSINTNYPANVSYHPTLPVVKIIDNDVTNLRLSNAVQLPETNNGTTAFSYTVTLEKATGRNFTLKYVTLDGTATLTDNDYQFTEGILSFSGTAGESHTINVLVNGDLKIEADEVFSVQLSGLSDNFNSRLSIPVTKTTGNIQNDDEGIITITKIDGIEGSQDGRFIFSLPPGVMLDKDITINYRLLGTAKNSDYSVVSASAITIPAGENNAELNLIIADDQILEERETVIMAVDNIVNPYNNVFVALPIPVLYIYDNDEAEVSITSPAPLVEGNSGTKTLTFVVKLDKTTDKPFTLSYKTLDGTATAANSDYQPKQETLSFAGFAGESKTVNIFVNGDIHLEDDEEMKLNLFNLNNTFDGKLLLGEDGKGIILNDDIAPLANNDNALTQEDTPVKFSVIVNDSHADGIDPQTVNIVKAPEKGTLILHPSGEITFTPTLNINGSDSFTYTVKDMLGRVSNTATVRITIIPVNDAPVANDDVFYVQRDSSIRANVALNDEDVDLDVLTFSIKDNVANGRIDFFDPSDGTFIYIPNTGFKGEDRFTYIVSDPSGLKDTAEVKLYVQPKIRIDLTPNSGILIEGDSISITAKLTEFIYQDVNVVLNFGGTAEQNKDYTLSGNYDVITISARDTVTTQKFSIKSLRDYLKEGEETIEVSMISVDPIAFVEIGDGADIIIKDFYPEDKGLDPEENGDINPDPYMSPNGDGLGNEKFVIYNIERYPDNEVIIYNRWGNEVYTTKGYDNKDNAFFGNANKGMLANGNTPLVNGVYYFIIKTKGADGKPKRNKGYVIIKR